VQALPRAHARSTRQALYAREVRLAEKVGIVVGAGQSPGETVGTGRAAALVFAREGARVLLADRDLGSARETAEMIAREGGTAECIEGDWTSAADCRSFAAACVETWGRIDFLQNNVGIGSGDGSPGTLSEEDFDRILAVNLKGCLLSCQAVVPVMREQGSGSIVNISSVAALAAALPLTAYKISKAGINALGHSLAVEGAPHGIRVNTIMPGLLDTPMAIDAWARALKRPRDEVRAQRDKLVPLRGKMGTGWDVAHASLFLHSDEAGFITGVALAVDGGQLTRIGG
jgi:NAD(P)-dependent dehydrogenase (short-subunit alcohol dehydrogenase family)